MTKKDYVLIADSLRNSFYQLGVLEIGLTNEQKNEIIDRLANNLWLENNKFDSVKFSEYILIKKEQFRTNSA